MPEGFVTANLFDVDAWKINDPVKVEIIVRNDGDQRPTKFYGLVHDVDRTKLTLMRLNASKAKELVLVFIEEVNDESVQVTRLADTEV